MGAGCYYTLPDDRAVLAYWLDLGHLGDDELDYDFNYDCAIEVLKDVILDLPLASHYNDEIFYGKNFKIEFDSTYNGDGILVNLLIDLYDYDPLYPLMVSNLSKVYYKIIKHINKSLPLCKAGGSYSSCHYAVNELK